MAKSCIFHELIELSRDEESTVRIASLETLVDQLNFFDNSKSIIVCLYLLVRHLLKAAIIMGCNIKLYMSLN